MNFHHGDAEARRQDGEKPSGGIATPTAKASATEKRRAAIAEALSWARTPFDFNQCAKGLKGGVDCGRFLASALNAAGKKIDIAKLPTFPPGWFLHNCRRDTGASREERLKGKAGIDFGLLEVIEQFATEYRLTPAGLREVWYGPTKTKPEPADIVIAQCGKDWAHTALVIDWPKVIGSACEHVVTVWENIFRSPQYMNRELKFFDPFSTTEGTEEGTQPGAAVPHVYS